jgi:hypothetical protein
MVVFIIESATRCPQHCTALHCTLWLSTATTLTVQGRTIDNPSLAMVETVAIAWFTLEYLIRLAGAPARCDFLKDGMNIIDVLAIMPFFVSLFLAKPLDVQT